MSITPREIIEAAYPKSTKNQPGAIATEGPELLNQVNRVMAGLLAAGSRINVTYFGAKETVTKTGAYWARPATAEAVFLVTKTDGTKVHIVPFDDQALMGTEPAVYRYGGAYYEANSSLSAVSDLDLFFSQEFTAAATLDTSLDARWPDRFNELPILLTAYYLSVKDGRPEEYAGLEAQIQHQFSLYLAFLEHETLGELRRFEPVRFNASEAVVPITDLLGLARERAA